MNIYICFRRYLQEDCKMLLSPHLHKWLFTSHHYLFFIIPKIHSSYLTPSRTTNHIWRKWFIYFLGQWFLVQLCNQYLQWFSINPYCTETICFVRQQAGLSKGRFDGKYDTFAFLWDVLNAHTCILHEAMVVLGFSSDIIIRLIMHSYYFVQLCCN